MPNYIRPGSLDAALAALDRDGARRTVPFAGCTDLMVRWKRGATPRPDAVVDLKTVRELDRIETAGGHLHVGPCARLSRIANDPLVREHASVLGKAAGLVACPQVRNRATIGGNLCNASPAADTALPLIVLDAVLEIRSVDGKREVPAADFFRGPGETVLQPGELLAGIRIPLPDGPASGEPAFSCFKKFGTRPSMEVALVSAATSVTLREDTVTRARIAFGSVAPVPLRSRAAESCLEDRSLDDEAIGAACTIAMNEVSPISDVRASAEYRRELVGVLLRRMLEDAQRH